MNKFRKLVVFVLILALGASALYGCGNKTENPGTTPEPNDTELHEIYKLENRIALTNVIPAILKDRSNINKGLPDGKKDKVKIGLVTWTTGTPFFAAMMETVKEEAAKYGYEVIVTVSDGNLDKQIAAIETFVTLGVDVILDIAFDVNAERPAIKDAVAAGIPVIGLGLPFPEDVPVVTTVAVNYYYNGFAVGQYYGAQAGTDYVKAATMPGMMGHTIAESKINGVLGGFLYERYKALGKPFDSIEDAILAGNKLMDQLRANGKFVDADSDFEVVANLNGYWSVEGGLKAAEDILTANKDINLFITDNDQMGFGAIKAMEQVGIKVGTDVKIISVGDGTKECMEKIKSGEYLAVALASPYTWSKSGVDLIRKIFAEGFDANNLPSVMDMENIVITKENVDEHYNPNRAFGVLPDLQFKSITELNAEAAK